MKMPWNTFIVWIQSKHSVSWRNTGHAVIMSSDEHVRTNRQECRYESCHVAFVLFKHRNWWQQLSHSSKLEANTLLAFRFSHARVKFLTINLSRSMNYRFCAVAILRALKSSERYQIEVFYLFIEHCFWIARVNAFTMCYSILIWLWKTDNYQLAD